MSYRSVVTLCLVFSLTSSSRAQEPETFATYEKKVAGTLKVLADTIVTEPFQEAMPFEKVLRKLEMALEKKLIIQIDEKAFGKELPNLLKSSVKMPPYPKRMRLALFLQIMLSKVYLEHAAPVQRIEPGRVVITTETYAYQTLIHDVADLVPQLPRLVAEGAWFRSRRDSMRMLPPDVEGVKPDDGAGLLIRWLTAHHAPRGLQVRNGTRLVVDATNPDQFRINDKLHSMRRQLDLSVILHARIYEVDPAFFAKNIVPLLTDGALPGESRTVSRCSASLANRILKERLIQEGDAGKVLPRQKAVFLARQNAFTYQALPGGPQGSFGVDRTDLEGVTFSFTPVVSPDRRCVRLEITQEVAQLLGTSRTKVLDPRTGRESEVDVPNLRKRTIKGAIDVDDDHPFVMPIDYVPAKGNVWLLLASPRIRIEEELRDLKAAGEQVKPPFRFEEEKPDEKPAKELPRAKEVEQILEAAVKDVLTNPELKDVRAVLGTPGDNRFGLDGGWPSWFRANVAGFRQDDPKGEKCRGFRTSVPNIRLQAFEWKGPGADPGESRLEIVLSNVGFLGACKIRYVPRKEGDRWGVQFIEGFDP